MAREYDKAIEAWLKAVSVYENLSENNGYTRALPLVNIGTAHWLLGDLKQASLVLGQGLEKREKPCLAPTTKNRSGPSVSCMH